MKMAIAWDILNMKNGGGGIVFASDINTIILLLYNSDNFPDLGVSSPDFLTKQMAYHDSLPTYSRLFLQSFFKTKIIEKSRQRPPFAVIKFKFPQVAPTLGLPPLLGTLWPSAASILPILIPLRI